MLSFRGGINLKEYGSRAALAKEGFSPADVAGLEKWYDSSTLNTLFQDSLKTTPVIADGDPVGAWVDKMGSGDDVLQTITARKPTYRSSNSAYNNKPALEFDGGDWLVLAAFALGVISQPLTVFWVGGQDAPATDNGLYSGVTSICSFRSRVGGNATLLSAGILVNAGTANTGKVIYTVTWNGAATKLWKDGALASITNPGVNGLDGFQMGRDQLSGQVLTGDIAEVLVYSTNVSADDSNLIHNYFSSKYDIAVTEIT